MLLVNMSSEEDENDTVIMIRDDAIEGYLEGLRVQLLVFVTAYSYSAYYAGRIEYDTKFEI